MKKYQSNEVHLSKSYIDAMKALQETCKKLRKEIQELKSAGKGVEEKANFQKKLYEEKIEDLIKKSLENEKELKMIIQKKDEHIEELIGKNRAEQKAKKQILKETAILQKGIQLLERNLEDEKKSKKIVIKNLEERQRILDETKQDLIRVIEESKKIQGQLSSEIALFDKRNREMGLEIEELEQGKMKVISKMQGMSREIKMLLVQNEELKVKNTSLGNKIKSLKGNLSTQENKELEIIASKEHKISKLSDKLKKTKNLIKRYKNKTQEEASLDKKIITLLEKSTKIGNPSAVANLLDKVEELVIDNNKLKRENLVELKVLEFIEK